MPAYREIPKQEHYTAAIWACENSDQYKLAIGVFYEMKNANINRTVKTYEGLISVAEKTKNWEKAIEFFDGMVAEGIQGGLCLYYICSMLKICVIFKYAAYMLTRVFYLVLDTF